MQQLLSSLGPRPLNFTGLAPNESISSSGSSLHYTEPPALSAGRLSPSHPSSFHPQEVCPIVHQRETVYAHLNPPEPTSPNSQFTNEGIPGDDNHFILDNDDQIFLPSTSQVTRESIMDGDVEAQPVADNTNGNSEDADMEGKSVEIFGMPEDGLSGGPEDGGTSDQEDRGQERDSDFEFLSEDAIETDSDSEPDPAPDNDQNMDAEDVLEDTPISNRLLAKGFLENTWNHLCDCKEEENALEPGGDPMFDLKQMAEYWQDLGVPDAIGHESLPPERGEEKSPFIDWFSVLSGGDQRPHLCLEKSQHSAPHIQRTWDIDSIICWASCLSINQGLYLSYFPLAISEPTFMFSIKGKLCTSFLTFRWVAGANHPSLAYMSSSPESPMLVEQHLISLKLNTVYGLTDSSYQRSVMCARVM
jgi:hypothetical protein